MTRRAAILCLLLAAMLAWPASAAPPPPPDGHGDSHGARSRAERLARALGYASRYLAPDAAAQLAALARPEALVPLVSALVAGVVAQEVPVVGEAVDVALVTWAAYALGWEAVLAAGDFVRFAKGALWARSEADLDQAGQHFARFVARVGVDVALAVLLHKTAQRLGAEIRESGPGGPGGGGPGGELTPAAAGAGGAGRPGAAPRYRVRADGTIVALGATAAGVSRRDGEEEGGAAGGGAASAAEAGSAAAGAHGGASGTGAPAAAPTGLSPRLRELRQTLGDPRALAAFDRKFEQVGRDLAQMEHVVEGMQARLEAGKTFEQRMIEEGQKRKPPPGPRLGPEVLAEIDGELARGERIGQEIERFAAAHPDVKGIGEWRTTLGGNLESLREMKAGLQEATPGNIQAVRGPLSGLEAVLETAWEAERVVAVEHEFQVDKVEIQGKDVKKVNVDVVADGGATWIESKAGKPFGLGSSAWAECKQQALRQLEAARHHAIGGKPPRIVFRFSRGVSRAVASALEALGIEVRGTRVF